MSTAYLPEPTTAAEVMERARAAHRRRAVWTKPVTERLSIADISRQWAEADAKRRHDAEARKEAAAKRIARTEAKVELTTSDRVRTIIAEVSAETGIPIPIIIGHRKSHPILRARNVAIKRVALATGWSLPRIGKVFNRDHTTIQHTLRKMGLDYRSTDAISHGNQYSKKWGADHA